MRGFELPNRVGGGGGEGEGLSSVLTRVTLKVSVFKPI